MGSFTNITMAPKGMKAAAMKAAAMKAASKAMSKGALADVLATSSELKKSVVSKLLAKLAEVGATEVKKSGVFTVPGLARIKTRRKPATKATKRMMFGPKSSLKQS